MADVGTIFIVDDDAELCSWGEQLLHEAGYHVRTFPSAEAFLDSWDGELPDCLLLDVCLPQQSGLELQSCLAHQPKQPPVILMSGYADLSMALTAWEAGAAAFLEKPFRSEELFAKLDLVLQRDTLSRAQRSRKESLETQLALLTTREREVLDMIVDGQLTKQIAYRLCISDRTVETHRANLMKKLQVHTLAELVALAVEHRLYRQVT